MVIPYAIIQVHYNRDRTRHPPPATFEHLLQAHGNEKLIFDNQHGPSHDRP
jgi:hypothetical protein